MELFKNYMLVLVLVFGVILINYVTPTQGSSRSSELIKFENGRYNDIIIAIDGSILSEAECMSLRGALDEILPDFSNSLHQATGGRASLGRVNVLMPSHWRPSSCNVTSFEDAPSQFRYSAAHLQITEGHPLATSLPWTRQYKPCGQGGDSIVIPLSFLQSNSFSKLIKGRLLLHEWTRFRYGVFDEIGYIDGANGLLDPCYMLDKQAQFTSCTGSRMPSIALNKSACSLEYLERQQEFLERRLVQSNTSVMSFPYMENVAHYCDQSTHNSWAATKQNIYCRRSVGQVVNSHKDFRTPFQNENNPMQNPSPPGIKILQRRDFETAYAFVIDNSTAMHDEYKILHVKQAIAEFVQMLEIDTEVHIIIFSNSQVTLTYGNKLKDESVKERILENIPELNGDNSMQASRRLVPVIDTVIANLSATQGANSWNVIIFSDSTETVEDMSEAIERFRETPHSLSIFTFESESSKTSEAWLNWYRIPNTKNVMVLPYCRINGFRGPCSLQTSIFIVDHLLGLLNEQEEKPRLIQKVEQVVISNVNNQVANFNLDYDPSRIKHVYFFFPLPQTLSDASSFIKLSHSSGECSIKPVLSYNGVMTFDENGCSYKSGQWSLRLENKIPSDISRLHLDVFVEYIDAVGIDRLLVASSLGQTDLTEGIQPNTNLTSVFVHLSVPQGNPVLDANVQLEIFYPFLMSTGQGELPATQITLKDDGNSNDGADQTANDGIYSGYLHGYSKSTPSYHLVQIRVSTSANTKVLQTIDSPNAAFLKRELREKCCGKVVRPRTTRSIQAPFKFQTLHLGFKTLNAWTKTAFPPGSIGLITVTGESETYLTIQFDSVAGDRLNGSVPVQSIYACCLSSSSTESPSSPPDETHCKEDTTDCGTFSPPGSTQSCQINKEKLVKSFIPSTEEGRPNLLICGLRVFNANFEAGGISSDTFQVTLTEELLIGVNDDEPECHSIHDGCLPIFIFWIMIGCLALLLLVIVIILIAWLCTLRSKKGKPKTTQTQTPVHTTSIRKDLHTPYRALDEDSIEYTTVAHEKKKPEEPNVVRELYVNHAYIQNEDGDLKIIADNGKILRKPLNDMVPGEPTIANHNHHSPIRRTHNVQPTDNMQVYKTEPLPNRQTGPVPQTRSIKPTYQNRPQIIHQNPNLRSDSSEQHPNETTPVSPTNIIIPNAYATVSRAGRIRPLSGEPISSPEPVKLDPHYRVPINSTMPVRSDRIPRRDPIPTAFRSQPPPPIHPYPSSDTDSTIYADVRKPPKFAKPPPYPTGSRLVTSNSPPQISTFRPTKSISSAGSPPAFPPVPPPRFDRSKNVGSPPKLHFRDRHLPNDDEDSDEWDDGDNEYFGTSYA